MTTTVERPLVLLLFIISTYGEVHGPPNQSEVWRVVKQIMDESDGEFFGEYLPEEDELPQRGAPPAFAAHMKELLRQGLITLQQHRLILTDVGRTLVPNRQTSIDLQMITRYIAAVV